ncbi:MAG TPA: hypothetical protein EYO73_06685 [Sulfurimonas sp.]|nr:hypothetical protein [Sulfurimonas sp.]
MNIVPVDDNKNLSFFSVKNELLALHIIKRHEINIIILMATTRRLVNRYFVKPFEHDAIAQVLNAIHRRMKPS